MTKTGHGAGAKIVLGEDSGNPCHVPGFSVHAGLGRLVNAGLALYEAIDAGTRDAAGALGRPVAFATIAVGKRVCLILVEANPLEQVTNADHRAGVMVWDTGFPRLNWVKC